MSDPTARLPLLSLVCPVYNEESSLAEFYGRARAALESISPAVAYEFVFVDDGSADGSRRILRDLSRRDPGVRVIELSRNFGHQVAITAGIDSADGDAVVVIDSDLQDPPEVVPLMVEEWRQGHRVVFGVRRVREGESRFKRWTAKAFYRLLNRLSDTDLPLDSGDFRLLDRKVVLELRKLRERNRYVRGLVAWVGFQQSCVEYDRAARHAGESKYTLEKMARLAIDAVTSFSAKPLRIAWQLGALATTAAIGLAAWFLLGKLLAPDRSVPGFASLMVVVLLFGGLQLLCVGLIGEYVARTYVEVKERPLYIVEERINFPADEPEVVIEIDGQPGVSYDDSDGAPGSSTPAPPPTPRYERLS
jgi:dolichol-phosphate mannosyltransferase